MDTIVSFLEENYFYVAGIGLIIIIMLIGLISSSRKARKAKALNNSDQMANIDEVKTGGIDQVAEQFKGTEVESADVASISVESEPVVEPVQEDLMQPMSSINASSFPESTATNEEDRFAKTEIIDFSAMSEKSDPTPTPFASDSTKYNDSLLNGEETESTPIDINKAF